ncbi:endonuclease/exonuclease/phosphatase family protein [Desertimonas flava]|uniref:endonuclease/exonuclease/phosphatase family protein n=1 Tax=Desertimonas flava TaxID=2064846 RepID=UPI0013C43104|nr:endonuclease/exonuclease/phosphatase family protein [Desertimonas flava]
MDPDEAPISVTVLTWNLQGSHGLDTDAVAAVIREWAPDVVLLQEIQRRQSRRLAAAVSMRRRWVFKHVSLWAWPEGLAVLTPWAFSSTAKVVLRRSPLFTWRRRVAVLATIESAHARVSVVNVHLSPHDEGDARGQEASTVVGRAGGAVVGGDFNDCPGGPAPARLESAGWTDAWASAHPHGEGFTNWSPGHRAGRRADQRLDYVMAPPGWAVLDATVGATSVDEARLGELSDHLPLVVRLGAPEGSNR